MSGKKKFGFAPHRKNRTKVVIGETKFGLLTVVGVHDDIIECVCSCGTQVMRGPNSILIRKFQCCDTCRSEYVSEQLEKKEKDKHAHRRSAHQEGSENSAS
jgi:hypothetical protein